MWIQDLAEALNRLPEKYIYSCCFNSINSGYDTIVFKTDTFSLVYYKKAKTWKKINKGEWKEK